jgi:hypothetical protein
MTARLESRKQSQLAGEAADLRVVVTNADKSEHVARELLSVTKLEISSGSEWMACWLEPIGPQGVVSPTWMELKAGDELPVGLGRFLCEPGADATGRTTTDWTSLPGVYRLRAHVAHSPSKALLRADARVPGDVSDGEVDTNVIEVTVQEPHAVDADAFAWARANGHDPVSVQVARQFPASSYAALLIWRSLMVGAWSPEDVHKLMSRGQYPAWSSVPDPASPDGWRSVDQGRDMAQWRVEQGERILRDRPHFPYEAGVRLSVGLSYAALGKEAKAKKLLTAVAAREASPEAKWAASYLSLRGWR